MKSHNQKARILIVDDQIANTILLENFLMINGYTNYVSTNDSRDVEHLVKTNEPDLILLDVMMPYLSGTDILNWLSEQKYLEGAMRIMVLTADVSQDTLKDVLKAGAHDILRKPFDLVELELRISNLLQANEMIRELDDRALHLKNLVNEKTIQLTEKNEELEQFIYVASHDTQEPLRMITGFLQLLEKKYNPILDEKGKKYINYAIDGADRMKTLITDMLEFSRAGKLSDNDFKEVDLNEIMNDVLLSLKRKIDSSEARIEVEKLPKVQGMDSPLKHVFQNLISNAITYQPNGQKAIISVKGIRNEKGDVVVTVTDNGIGIDPKDRKKIFEVFTRLHLRDEYGGSGIGLSISKKIMERLGGSISLKSELGKGSEFLVSFYKK
jgi:signal transduction histidine kinase